MKTLISSINNNIESVSNDCYIDGEYLKSQLIDIYYHYVEENIEISICNLYNLIGSCIKSNRVINSFKEDIPRIKNDMVERREIKKQLKRMIIEIKQNSRLISKSNDNNNILDTVFELSNQRRKYYELSDKYQSLDNEQTLKETYEAIAKEEKTLETNINYLKNNNNEYLQVTKYYPGFIRNTINSKLEYVPYIEKDLLGQLMTIRVSFLNNLQSYLLKISSKIVRNYENKEYELLTEEEKNDFKIIERILDKIDTYIQILFGIIKSPEKFEPYYCEMVNLLTLEVNLMISYFRDNELNQDLLSKIKSNYYIVQEVNEKAVMYKKRMRED